MGVISDFGLSVFGLGHVGSPGSSGLKVFGVGA